MMANPHLTRVDTQQIKNDIYQRIGTEKAKIYLDHLERFLNLKGSKIELVKICIQTIGRENLYLHNLLIQSIIHNAKLPPKEAFKVNVANMKSHLQCAFPQTPRKCRSSVIRARKFKERKSPLGPLGKSPSITYEESVSRLQEELGSLSGLVEDGEEVDQSVVIPASQRWAPVTAPIGVSLSMGADRNSTSLNNCFSVTCQSSRELPDTNSLGLRLQEKLGEDGVGISSDGANVLNKSLDVYLKKLISQCVGIAGARCGDPTNGNEVSPGQQPPRQPTSYACLLDFCVAIESNPSVLGEDWPQQLEKIYKS